jgi:WD40 repeat protein
MHRAFALKPENIIGLHLGQSFPFFLKRKNNNFLIHSINSCLFLFNLKNLMIRSKSPFLHHIALISRILSIKNRTFVIIKNTVHILDYLVPITRFSICKGKNLFLLTNDPFFLIYNNQENKIKLMNPWTFKLISEINLQTEAIDIQIENLTKNKDFLLILNIKKNLEIWDLKKKICNVKFYCNYLSQIVSFKYLNKPKILVFGFNDGNLIFYNFTKINFNIEIKKKIGTILEIFDSFFLKDFFFFRNNNFLYLFNILKNTFKNIGKIDSFDRLYCIQPAYNFISFLKIKIYEKKIYLFRYYYKKKKTQMIVSRIGNKFPLEKLKMDIQLPDVFVCTSVFEKIYILKYDYFKNSKKLNFNIEKKNKLKIKELQIKYFSFNQRYLCIAICFYQLYKPVLFKINKMKILEVNINLPSQITKCGRSISICFSKNANYLLIGYDNNCVSLFDLSRGKYLFVKQNHIIKNKKNKCKVISLSYDKNSEFFISGCFCGVIILWDSYKFSKINFLKIKKKIYLLKWCERSDLIIIFTINNEILVIFPETFSIIRKFSGHKKKIHDFLILKNSNILITCSSDKTIKIWNFIKNKCEYTLRFFYSPISLVLDKNESILISSHQYTLGLGLIQIYKSKINYKKFEYYKNSVEKNGKLLSLKKGAFNVNCNQIIAKVDKKDKLTNNLFVSKKKKSNKFKIVLNNINISKKTQFNYLKFCLLNCNQLKNLFKIQLKKSKEIKNYNTVLFFFEIFFESFMYDFKLDKWITFFPFFNKTIIWFINQRYYNECIFVRMSIESNRKYLKYTNFYY